MLSSPPLVRPAPAMAGRVLGVIIRVFVKTLPAENMLEPRAALAVHDDSRVITHPSVIAASATYLDSVAGRLYTTKMRQRKIDYKACPGREHFPEQNRHETRCNHNGHGVCRKTRDLSEHKRKIGLEGELDANQSRR
jgi:hypothetical protein